MYPLWEDDYLGVAVQFLQRGTVPVPLPRSNPPQRVSASGGTGDLMITASFGEPTS